MNATIERVTVAMDVNGARKTATIEARTNLADLLRDTFNFTGTHLGCEHGVCGACTVLLDGQPIRACITLAAAAADRAVTTIEGHSDRIVLALREAFKETHGLQCGFCTPGMIITASDLLRRKLRPTEVEIRREMSGNLCRCTGYSGIVKAIALAAERLATTRTKDHYHEVVAPSSIEYHEL